MTFSNYNGHVTPLYKSLDVLKLNDIYRIELAKFMHKLHHGAVNKIYDNFFQNISDVHSYKTSFADMATIIISYKESMQILEKKYFSWKGCALERNRTETANFALPHVTFCKHYKDRLLNYE